MPPPLVIAVMISLLVSLALAAAPVSVPTSDAALNPRAEDLIDSDPALKQWAVRLFDRNNDGWLTLYEAQPAVAGFREIADADHDGRVTVREFEAGLAFIAARY